MERLIERKNYKWIQQFMENGIGVGNDSLERYWSYLRHLLLWAMETLLCRADTIRPSYLAYVTNLPSPRGDGPISHDTRKKMLGLAKRFFCWAKTDCPEFRSLPSTWICTLKYSKPARRCMDEHIYVSLDEMFRLIEVPADENDLALRRDKGAAAALFLTGMRAEAFTTAPIQAFNFNELYVQQWADLGVVTKNGTEATTFMLPIPNLIDAALKWDTFVRAELPPMARWYAATDQKWGDQQLSQNEPGKNRNTALDKRLKLLYAKAELPYKSAHKFRHGHAVWGLQHARTMADYKAVSMNLMHGNVKVTDEIYAPLLSTEVQQRIAYLASNPVDQPDDDLRTFVSRLSNAELSKVMVAVAERLAA